MDKLEEQAGTHFKLNVPAQKGYVNPLKEEIDSLKGSYAGIMREMIESAEEDRPREERGTKFFGTPVVWDFQKRLEEIRLREAIAIVIDAALPLLSSQNPSLEEKRLREAVTMVVAAALSRLPSPNPSMFQKQVLHGTLVTPASQSRRADK